VKTILQSAASVLGGEAAVRVANYAVILFVARAYGARTLGVYALVLSIVTVVVMFADAGLQTAAITQLSHDTANRNQVFGLLTISKLSLLATAALLLCLYAALSRPGSLFVSIGMWLGLRTILQSLSQLQMAALKSVSRANLIGAIQSAHCVMLLCGLLLAHRFAWTLNALLVWLVAAQFFELLLAVTALACTGVYPRWSRAFHFYPILKLAAPFGLAYGLANLIIRTDTIILAKFVSLSELGAFSAANSLLLLVYVASWLFSSILLPGAVRIAHQGEMLRSWSNAWLRRVALFGIPAAFFAAIIAPKLVAMLFGPAYSSGGIVASLMLLACPFILLNSVYATFTIATNNRVVLLSAYVATVLATFVLDVALGRMFGSLGIAVAIVVRETIMLFVFWLLTSGALWPAAKFEPHPFSEGN